VLVAGIVALVGSLFAWRINPASSGAYCLGALFGMANLAVLAGLVRAVIRVDGPARGRALVFGALKLPVLYGILIALLLWAHVEPLAFLVGFTSILATLLVVGLVMRSDGVTSNKRPAPDAIHHAPATPDAFVNEAPRIQRAGHKIQGSGL
jgi:hypothetical protein